jgi:hypothetical protein
MALEHTVDVSVTAKQWVRSRILWPFNGLHHARQP